MWEDGEQGITGNLAVDVLQGTGLIRLLRAVQLREFHSCIPGGRS